MIKSSDWSDFWIIDNKLQYFKRSISIIKSLKCQYVLKNNSLFKKFCNKFTYNFVKTNIFIFCIFSSNTLQVLMFVCPTALELRFYGCCHPCCSYECIDDNVTKNSWILMRQNVCLSLKWYIVIIRIFSKDKSILPTSIIKTKNLCLY